jgi:serine/threonine protein kinase
MTAEPTPRPYFVMERLQGDTLHAVMHRRGEPFAMRSSIDVAIELLEALDVAHNPPHRLLHRDIKPANIFMSRVTPHETRAVLLDFGLAHMFERASKQTGKRFLGTLEYASPEQLRGEPLTPRSDLYNVGLVLFEMIAGRHVFAYCKRDRSAHVNAHLHDDPVRLSSLGVDMDPALDAVVHSSLQKDPAARPKSAHEFASVLKAIRTSADFVRRRPALDAKTEEEPFETLWARMGVTPTTAGVSARSGPENASEPSNVSSGPRYETREDKRLGAAFAATDLSAITSPKPTEELPNTRAHANAMKKFRAADTETAPPRRVDELDRSSPPIVLDRVRKSIAQNGLLIVCSTLAAAAAMIVVAVYAKLTANKEAAVAPATNAVVIVAPSMTSAATVPTATPTPTPSAKPLAIVTAIAPTLPPVTPIATTTRAPSVATQTAPSASASASAHRVGSGLDDNSAAARNADLLP